MPLYLVEVPEDPNPDCNTESSFVHSHDLDLEGILVKRMPDRTIQKYEDRLLMNEMHGAN